MVKARKVTIRDVANAAAVSPSTVSMVLNNSERSFTDEVRQRVLKAVKTLKYHPTGVGRPSVGNPRRKLESMRPKVVMLLDGPLFSVSDSIYGMVQKGAEFELKSRKIDLIIQNTEAFMLTFETAGVIHFSSDNPVKKQLIGNKAEVVCMGKINRNSTVDHVSYCNHEISILAAQYLLKRGHSHIGFMPFNNAGLFAERFEVFTKLMHESGVKYSHTPPTDHGDLFDDPANLERVLRNYLSGPDRPTALFIPADTVTSIAYPLLYSIGVIPGKDIEIVTCNNEYLRMAGLNPKPTVIDIKAFDVGRMAAVQLLARIQHPNSSPVKIKLMPELIEGRNWDKFNKESTYYR
jgi:DNA-binding LacI/PurR family transcriptional regulator